MTIASTTNRVTYTGNGATTSFSFPHYVIAAADLKVYVGGVLQTITTHYTLSGSAPYTAGTNVQFVTAPASDAEIIIIRDPAITQAVDPTENGPLPVDTQLERPLDLLTMLCQRLAERVTRSLRQPDTDFVDIDAIPAKANRLSKYLGFDSDGDPVALDSPANTTSVSAYMATVLVAASSAAARTLLRTPSAALVCNGRLTLTTGLPVTAADVTAATTLYFTPYKGNEIGIWDGAVWKIYTFSELSIAVPATTNTMYDVFVYDNAGTPTLELTAWTNDTTRATALVLQNGVHVKSGATTRRYLGSFRTTGVSGQTEDSLAKRYVWNAYNRVARPMRVLEAANSWTYTTATFRQMNANAANQLDFVQGLDEEAVEAEAVATASNSGGVVQVQIGINIDTVSGSSVASGVLNGVGNTPAAGVTAIVRASYKGLVGVGRHTIIPTEYSTATGTTTWYGDNGNAGLTQCGIHGIVRD